MERTRGRGLNVDSEARGSAHGHDTKGAGGGGVYYQIGGERKGEKMLSVSTAGERGASCEQGVQAEHAGPVVLAMNGELTRLQSGNCVFVSFV